MRRAYPSAIAYIAYQCVGLFQCKYRTGRSERVGHYREVAAQPTRKSTESGGHAVQMTGKTA
eukprot:3725114-Rhodomonas_salina.2